MEIREVSQKSFTGSELRGEKFKGETGVSAGYEVLAQKRIADTLIPRGNPCAKKFQDCGIHEQMFSSKADN